MPSSPRSTSPARRKRSTTRLLVLTGSGLLLTTIAALTIVGGIGYWMWQGTPEHWAAQQRFRADAGEKELARLAAAAENRAVSRITDIDTRATDGVSRRTLRLSFDQINAWLDRRLDDWLSNQGAEMPAGLESPMLTSESGDLVLSFRARTAQLDQVISVVFGAAVQPDGRVRLRVKQVLGGRLPMPVDRVIGQVARQLEDSGEASSGHVRRVLNGEPAGPLVMRIDGSRRARLVDLAVREDGVTVTLNVERQ